MKKKEKKIQSIIEIRCSECKKVTKHYLSKNGDYKCLICGKVNKLLPREIEFVPDEDFFEEKKLDEFVNEEAE